MEMKKQDSELRKPVPKDEGMMIILLLPVLRCSR